MTEGSAFTGISIRACVVWLFVMLGGVFAACGGSEPSANGGSSETHFLRRCTTTCEGGLRCACGVCSKPCDGDEACKGLAEQATCEMPAASSCGGRTEPAACELTCERDTDCAALAGDLRCTAGVCRVASAPGAGSGASGQGGSTAGSAGSSAAGSAAGGRAGGAAGSASAGSTGAGSGGSAAGVMCGATLCAEGMSCCDKCNGSCIGATSGAFCPDDADPNRVCGDAGTPEGFPCGDVVCGADERCCDKCQSACINALSGANCPDDNDPDRICTDAGSAQCSVSGDSCLARACCAGLSCCSGIPVPSGEANCYPNDCPDSDQNLKRDIVTADTDAVLSAVASLPIARWRYTDDPAAAPHIGPMAQDFQAAFGGGSDDRHIAKVDGDGVSLAAIQALYRRVIELEQSQHALGERNAWLERELSALRSETPALCWPAPR